MTACTGGEAKLPHAVEAGDLVGSV